MIQCIDTFVLVLVNILFNLFRELRKKVFASRAVEEGLKLPEIHLLINNRVSEYELRCVFLLIKHFNLFIKVVKGIQSHG